MYDQDYTQEKEDANFMDRVGELWNRITEKRAPKPPSRPVGQKQPEPSPPEGEEGGEQARARS
jgi:hypothetical protein